MPQLPKRLSKASQALDELLAQFGPEGLAIELSLRGLGGIFQGPQSESYVMEEVIWEYKEHVRLLPIAPKSKETYWSELGQFSRYLESEGVLKEDAAKVLIDRVYGSYLASKMATNTRNKKVVFLRNLHNFAKKNGWVTTPIPKVLKTETVAPGIPRALSKEAVKELMELTRTTRYAQRYNCLVALMLASGCRIGEVATLRIGDIDFSNYLATVYGKYHPDGRTVYLGEQAAQLLREYIEFTYGADALTDARYRGYYVYSARGGTSVPNIGSIQETFRGLVAKMKTATEEEKKHLTPHSLRHTFATTGLECGLDLYTISKLLGHRNVASTVIYTHVSDRRMRAAVEKTQNSLEIKWR